MAATTFTRDTPIGAADVTTDATATLLNSTGGQIIGIGWLEEDLTTAGTQNAIQIVDVSVNEARLISCTVTATLIATDTSGLQVLVLEDGVNLPGGRFETGVVETTPLGVQVTFFSFSPSAGTHTYTFAYGISGGSGETANLLSSSDSRAYFVIRDEGPDPTV